MDLIFLGCGSSASIPSIKCVLTTGGGCGVCAGAHADPESKNRRGNPSLLVRRVDGDHQVLIDCGKTFRDSVLRFFPTHGVTKVDSVLLTHGHSDATLGLDDLRDVQHWETSVSKETGELEKVRSSPLTVYASATTMDQMKEQFGYLMPKDDEASTKGDEKVYRWTAQLDWQVLAPYQTLVLGNPSQGLDILPLPVYHGHEYICFGFELGRSILCGGRVVYFSDISATIEATTEILRTGDRIQVAIVDCFSLYGTQGTHFNLNQVVAFLRLFRPVKTYLTGMGHDFDYPRTNHEVLATFVKTEDLDIEMAYDGLHLQLS